MRAIAPEGHTVCAATSTLAKLLTWQAAGGVRPGAALAHQADWIAAQLHGQQRVRFPLLCGFSCSDLIPFGFALSE